MCNQYAPSGPERVNEYFGAGLPKEPYRPGIGPWGRGPFVRSTAAGREVVVGQWALIGDTAKESKSSARIMTNNARSESVTSKHLPRSMGTRSALPDPCRLVPGAQLGERQERAVAVSQGGR